LPPSSVYIVIPILTENPPNFLTGFLEIMILSILFYWFGKAFTNRTFAY